MSVIVERLGPPAPRASARAARPIRSARARLRTPTRPDARRFWLAYALLAALVAGALVLDPAPAWLLAALLLTVLGIAAARDSRAGEAADAGRRAEAESFARILHGLARSVSPDAIVAAIVEELGSITGADHVVVVRRRPQSDGDVLDATLHARDGAPTSTTRLALTDLDPPAAGRFVRRDGQRRPSSRHDPGDGAPGTLVAQRIAEHLAWRVREAYGLPNSLTAPLTVDGRVDGAIIVARRTGGTWEAAVRGRLAAAAIEASAALARASTRREMETHASTDALTGLPNRRYFDEVVALARRRRATDRPGLLMIDIDRFKVLNDRHGHAAGDEVLQAVAAAITGAIRAADVPARFGGEEFVVLLRDPSIAMACEVAERIRNAVGSLDLGALGVPRVSVSIGVAVAEAPDEPVEAILAAADRALYRAKRAGRNRVVAA